MPLPLYYTTYSSPIGTLLLASSERGLEQLWLPNEVKEKSLPNGWQQNNNFAINRQIIQVLDDYFIGKKVAFDKLPLFPVGTPFQLSVWQLLRTIAYGKISYYSALAERLNNPKAIRAVGGAVGRNPIAILIPCHRVLGKDMSLTGYAGGLPTKTALLDLEKINYRA